MFYSKANDKRKFPFQSRPTTAMYILYTDTFFVLGLKKLVLCTFHNDYSWQCRILHSIALWACDVSKVANLSLTAFKHKNFKRVPILNHFKYKMYDATKSST